MSTYASSAGGSNRVVAKAHYLKVTFPFVYKYFANVQKVARIWTVVVRALSRDRAVGRVYIQTTVLKKPEWDADVGWMYKTYELFILMEVQPECIVSLHDEHVTEMQFRAFLADEFRNTAVTLGEPTNSADWSTDASKEISWEIDRCAVEALVHQQFLDAQKTYTSDEYIC